jgi:ABC-type antimicrobial peptide transport system permease subunit
MYGLKLIAGRSYIQADTIREFVVNETFVKKIGMKEPREVIGKNILLGNSNAPIVGVVKDFHQTSLRDPIEPIAITSLKKNYRMAGIKLNSENISRSLQTIENLFNTLFPDYIFEYRFLDDSIARFYDQEKRLSHLFKLLAAIGIFISCIGLYGLILYMTVQRNKEVGVRKVLGASVVNIIVMFFREFVWLVVIAFLIATPIAWYFMNNWLQDFTFRINITWWMFALVGIASLLVALATVSVQTFKTAFINPVKSIRTE